MLCFGLIQAQEPISQQKVRDNTPEVHALVHATVIQQPGKKLDDATLLIRDGKIEAVGKNVSIPADALVHDLKGLWIFPGLIEPWSNYGLTKPEKGSKMRFGEAPQYESKTQGPWSWNQAVKPEFRAAESIIEDEKAAQALRKEGFTTLQVVPLDGIFRGTAAVINLGKGSLSNNMLKGNSAAALSFDKGSSTQSYPSSLMGAIALIRQTFLDQSWYSSTPREITGTNLSLEALGEQLKGMNLLFEVWDYLDIPRAAKIGTEFSRKFIFKASGHEYQRLAEIKTAFQGQPVIVPLNFQAAYSIQTVADGREIPLSDLRQWEFDPQNPSRLQKEGISIAFTTDGLKAPADLWGNLRKAIKAGLSEDEALRALTLNPAAILGLQNELGSLEAGKQANFVVSSGNIFEEGTEIFETWVKGEKFEGINRPPFDLRGEYEGELDAEKVRISLSGKMSAPKATFYLGKDTLNGTCEFSQNLIHFSFNQKEKGFFRLSGTPENGKISGYGENPAGKRIRWTATRTGPVKEKEKKEKEPAPAAGHLTLPNLAFGLEKPAEAENLVIRKATLWTNGPDGIVQEGDIWIQEGKIKAVGKDLKVKGAVELDGKGLHVSPGIIDEHSHIAISRGVNEGTHNVSAEVRIGDVLNPDDINIYRQLSGGVTTSQLLHGSANPIGGQNEIIKLRWGSGAEEMKFAQAPEFIKFALGENVKQSNWGDAFTSRYPQTRAGVEQLIRDAFQAAKDQEKLAAAGNPLAKRRNLQLETLREILQNKRFITCHSYVQSEINMLMKLGDEMGFRVNTFTHILEGYKVAAQMKAHGVNASTFSDWWAYKFEVMDAIPYNAVLMAKAGINTCINSDDAEMGRRLNQEAAKSVKYGGMAEEDALKMVTLNPAKALHIDQYVGSLEVGKDADLVVWSDHPLSVYAVAKMTFVDGRRLFDRDSDLAMRTQVATERTALINKMMADKGADKKPFAPKGDGKLYHCDTLESDYCHE